MSTMSTSVNMAFPDAIGNLSDDCGGTTGEKKANDPVDANVDELFAQIRLLSTF